MVEEHISSIFVGEVAAWTESEGWLDGLHEKDTGNDLWRQCGGDGARLIRTRLLSSGLGENGCDDPHSLKG
jgi:hypothetical protein